MLSCTDFPRCNPPQKDAAKRDQPTGNFESSLNVLLEYRPQYTKQEASQNKYDENASPNLGLVQTLPKVDSPSQHLFIWLGLQIARHPLWKLVEYPLLLFICALRVVHEV